MSGGESINSRLVLNRQQSAAALLLILFIAGVCSTLHAINRPFWYDEICTVIMCRLPSVSAVWGALSNAADTNPPFFYVVARSAHVLVADDHVGYRLPSILALLSTVACLYAILLRRTKPLPALVGATFVLCTPLAAYAYEARPYALEVACVAAAILAWQRIEDSEVYSLLLLLALSAALLLHYYAILAWPAFVLAEASVWIFRRRFRFGVWGAIVLGLLPLLFFAKLLSNLRQYYGQNFWAQPGFNQIHLAQNWLFGFDGDWGWVFAVGLTIIFLLLNLERKDSPIPPDRPEIGRNLLPLEERVLIFTLLWLPLIAVIAAKLGHGGMTLRYMMPTVLGGALAFGYVIGRAPALLSGLMLILLLVNFTSSSVGVAKSVLRGTLLRQRTTAVGEAQTISARIPDPDLPIVISPGFQYLPMAYYTPANLNRKLFVLADPAAAVKFTGDHTDSIDLALLVLRRYFPLQVEDYAAFVSRHREFFLVSYSGGFEWLTARLAQDGNNLTVVSAEKPMIYKVTMKP